MPRHQENKAQSIVNALMTDIEGGEFGRSGQLPTRTQLRERFDTTVVTLNSAIKILQISGKIRTIGNRLEVAPPPLKMPAVTNDFYTFMEEQGLQPEFRNIEQPGRISLDAQMADRFSLELGTPAIRRVRIQGEKRHNIFIPYRVAETFYLPEIMDDTIQQRMQTDPNFNVTTHLEHKYGAIRYHTTTFITRNATEKELDLLHVPLGTAVNELYRLCYNAPSKSVILMMNHIIQIAHRFEQTFEGPVTL